MAEGIRWEAFGIGRVERCPTTKNVVEITGFLAREDVSQSAKQKILCENIEALYTLKAA